jgi:hypothetical protein
LSASSWANMAKTSFTQAGNCADSCSGIETHKPMTRDGVSADVDVLCCNAVKQTERTKRGSCGASGSEGVQTVAPWGCQPGHGYPSHVPSLCCGGNRSASPISSSPSLCSISHGCTSLTSPHTRGLFKRCRTSLAAAANHANIPFTSVGNEADRIRWVSPLEFADLGSGISRASCCALYGPSGLPS